ncbi:MAG: peptide chain release factor N(5)-glutamine methyltransferase [Planctomycetota bacterium]
MEASAKDTAPSGKDSSTTETWTVLRLLEWTTDFFKRKGSSSPRLDAEVLLAHARNCERIELYTAFNEEPTEEQRVAFREMIRRRGEGVPVAQLVGHKEFYSLSLRVDEHTLIPRPETEHLVIKAIDQIKDLHPSIHDRPIHVADIGTGSGAIAIAIASSVQFVEVFATDLSSDALEIAKWNAEKLGVAARIKFSIGDLFEAITEGVQFDVICSNPPYVSESEFETLDPVVRNHEPKSALVSGPTGTETIKRLLEQAKDRLRENGSILIELSPMIGGQCVQIAQDLEYRDVQLIKDLAGLNRVLAARR